MMTQWLRLCLRPESRLLTSKHITSKHSYMITKLQLLTVNNSEWTTNEWTQPFKPETHLDQRICKLVLAYFSNASRTRHCFKQNSDSYMVASAVCRAANSSYLLRKVQALVARIALLHKTMAFDAEQLGFLAYTQHKFAIYKHSQSRAASRHSRE